MNRASLPASVVALILAGASSHAAAPATAPSPPGAPKSARTNVLVAGAKVLQDAGPLAGFDVYLVGFHPMKDHPDEQMEAHHWCRQVNEDFAQCVLFDGNGGDAHLTGIEYIVSAKLHDSLPADEQAKWHPHNYEILSGQLVAPGLPAPAEHALMESKVNSYGKTWHVWRSGVFQRPSDPLPVGDAMLAWSFNRDGEAAPGMVAQRDQRMRIDSAASRANRSDLVPLARPQSGVDALAGRFGRPTSEVPGVVDAHASREGQP